jgi:ribosomal protein S18 acetylase RimI-like enzyme
MNIIEIKDYDVQALEDFVNNEIPNTFRYFNNKSSQQIIKNHFKTLIYLNDKKSIGYAHIDFDGLKYWFGICILPQYQGTGIGSKLISKSLEFFKDSDIQKLYLSVDKINKMAINLYTKNGFKICEDKPSLYIMCLEK